MQPRSLDDDEREEPPLDPAVERIRQRLKRLIIISSATLLVGLIAVLAAVIYKIGPGQDKASLAASAGEATIAGALPAGAKLLSTALDGRLLALTFESDGVVRIAIVDLATNKVLRRAVLSGALLPATP
ncbi:hypothetical protein SAMN02745157_4767 [Kaistia soli DSM 19436]|uniref:Uncharacterized protein n=1 Tax=Kaistia soli DSM 19436 TaxID=1122133 RepID=A0A1M5MER7_9HYPH|nr:hypothetical protein SAMN02745157_4767 [Kaistia soli DSM 19436]